VIDESLETPDKVRELQIKLYRKAKSEPDFRFYQLYDKVYREDVLLRAWVLAKANNGAPRVDGESFEDIESKGLMKWLDNLRKELHDKTYRPQPVRRVMIPKPGGGERWPLAQRNGALIRGQDDRCGCASGQGIPAIRDRVAQTAAKLILEPIFEADFEPNAYGYRPKKSAQDAIQEVDKLLYQGYTDVVDADLWTTGADAWLYLSGDKDANSSSPQGQYFDTIPHSELMQCVARRIVDKHVLHLIQMWLKVPVEERDEHGKKRLTGGKDNDHGTPDQERRPMQTF